MDEEKYLRYQRRRLARVIQKELGIKYTTAWRIVQGKTDQEVRDAVQAGNTHG